MSKTKKYHTIISDYIIEFADKFKNDDEFTFQTLIDEKRHHYQLLFYGWRDDQYIFASQFHFSIEHEQVWVHRNITDIEVGEELISRGIPKKDIVVAFVPEYARTHSGYGVAATKVLESTPTT